jgi:Histidine kinase-, DNA gyrase B-, and HSP90-like ATPase
MGGLLVERIFQPFQRLEGPRPSQSQGHGLGLAIVRAIATAHGATITTRVRPEGGLVIEVGFRATSPGPGLNYGGQPATRAGHRLTGRQCTLLSGDPWRRRSPGPQT